MSMRLNTRRRTAVATTTGLPRYARNDKVVAHTTTGLPRYARNDKVDAQGQLVQFAGIEGVVAQPACLGCNPLLQFQRTRGTAGERPPTDVAASLYCYRLRN